MDSFYTEKPSGLDRSRNDPTLISRSMRSMNHHELADRGVGCISPAAELDGKLRNPQRRRVPVACNRCRRRKIKCSGDTGDGQGCTNCRSAGAGHCQFLRVNSKECHGLNWPYSGAESTTIVPSSWRGVSLRGKSSVPPMGSNQGCMDAFQRSPSYDLVAADTQVYPRSMGLDSIHYDDEQSAGFGHSSAYGHPGTPSGVLPDYGASAWSPKTWNSMFNGNRATNGGIYPDPEASGAISQSPYTYMLPGQGLPSADLSQAANTMATVSSPEALSSDRTLPTPTSRSHQLSGSANGMGLLPTEGLHGLPLLSDFKGSFWNTRCGTSPDQRATPTHIVPSNAPFGTSSPPDFKCPSANTNAPELMFTYPPAPTTTDDISPPLSSTATIPSTSGCGNPPYPILDTLGTPSSEYGKIPSDTRLRGSFSRDHSSNGQRLMALANECTPEIYGYTSSEKSKARVTDGSDMHCSAATLMNGLPYTRVRHQDPPNAAFPFNLLPDTLPEYHRAAVENVHRPPVSPLGNQGAY